MDVQELTGGKSTDHDETGTHTGEETADAELAGHLEETRGDRLAGGALGLVDLGEESVGGLRDDGGGHTGDKTGTEVETGGLAVGEVGALLAPGVEDLLRGNLVDGELGHGVGDLLEENGTETSVEGTNTLLAEDTEETTDKTVSESGLRDETDTGSLEGAEDNVGEELGNTRRSEVDGLTVLGSLLDAKVVNGGLLPELVTTELEGTLERVADNGGAETSEESTSALLGDDLTEGVDHALGLVGIRGGSGRGCGATSAERLTFRSDKVTFFSLPMARIVTYLVVDLGLELDTGLDDIDGGEGTVGDGTAEGTSNGEAGCYYVFINGTTYRP